MTTCIPPPQVPVEGQDRQHVHITNKPSKCYTVASRKSEHKEFEITEINAARKCQGPYTKVRKEPDNILHLDNQYYPAIVKLRWIDSYPRLVADMKLRIGGFSKRGLVRKTFKTALANDEWYMSEINGILRTSSGAVQAVLEVKKTLRKHILSRVQKQETAEAAFWHHKETNSQAQLAMDGYRPFLSLNCHEAFATFCKAEPSYDEYLESGTRYVTAFFEMQAFGP